MPDGERGELVFTTLTKEAMPLIRYRTGDLTRLLPGTARSMRRIEKITGRTDDMLIIRGVNLFPSQVEEILLKEGALSPHYQLEVTREGRLDELTVLVEPRTEKDGGAARKAAENLARDIKSRIGVSAKTELRAPGAVERSAGKARRVVDKRAN